jgi:polyisoprenyl-phosphate glycosyltransferase
MKGDIHTMKLSLIIPVYNEDKVLLETYKRIKSVFSNSSLNLEFIFINDGSKDESLATLKSLKELDSRIVIISFSRNFGHQAAVSAGIKYCTGDYAVILDADLQDPPGEIPLMLQKAFDQSANVVYGKRENRLGESWIKKTAASVFYRFINKMSETDLPLDTGDFRLIDRKVINAFNSLEEKQKYVRGLISWLGFKQIEHSYQRDPRFAGETHYTMSRMMALASRGLFYFSKKPLLLSINIGIICVAIGLLLIGYVLFSKFMYPAQTISGWSSLSIIVVFFGGIQLLSIGLLGQYISSIFDEVKNRPEYIIDEIVN